MIIVADANVIFSMLIKQGITAELFFNPIFNIYVPEFILEEMANHKEEILSKTKRSKDEFEDIFGIIIGIANIVSNEELQAYLEKAKQVSPDKDDVMYFALALKLNCPIWSNDKKLKEQNAIAIYSTDELIGKMKEM